jgi:hypothetical protein
MGEYQRRQNQNDIFESALLVCGRKGKYQLTQEVTDMIRGVKGVPVMTVELSTHEAMTKIHNYTPKLNIDDTHRVSVAIGTYDIVVCVCVCLFVIVSWLFLMMMMMMTVMKILIVFFVLILSLSVTLALSLSHL